MTDKALADNTRRVMIYGSCVSRDAAEHFLGPKLELLNYTGRQSLVSAMAPKRDEWQHLSPALDSPFQRNAVLDDLKGSLLGDIEAFAPSIDLLLMDFVDERNGYLEFDDGGVVTRSLELVNSGLLDQLDAKRDLVTFGSERHLDDWTGAMERLANHLRSLELLHKVRFIRHRWAGESLQGHRFPFDESMLDPRTINSQLTQYYARASDIGFEFFAVPHALCVTDVRHRWGMAPFHFSDEFNHFIKYRVEEMLA
ncbi:DUF6270 domain-containing protein [Knoellia sp. S7-12]|uniref:DUF6270 domain-containing protein n=1 Tax=Knoellia sp. S7-12 TaxID=3126698 RepID=UPI003365F8C6